MTKLKLLNFCSNYKIGLTQALTEQTEELVKEKSIDLFNVSSEQEQEEGLFKRLDNCGARYEIISGLDTHAEFHRLVKELVAIIDRHKITHVNVHSNWQLALVAYIKLFRKSLKSFKIIYTIHGYRHNSSVKSKIAIIVIGTSLKLFADRVISMSSYVARKFPMVSKKTDLVYYFMKGNQYEQKLDPAPGYPIKMVFPAQFRHGKRQNILIQAVKGYIDKTGDESIQLILPGSGPLRDKMIDYTEQLGLSKNVSFPGQLKLREVAKLYLNSNIALCASNVETYGRCIAEPFMLGRCVITQKTGVAEDIIRDGENGLFFTDSKSLTDILIDLHLNPDKITKLSAQALKDRSIFSTHNIMKAYLNALNNA